MAAHIYQTNLDGLKFVLEQMEYSEGALGIRKKQVSRLTFLSKTIINNDPYFRNKIGREHSPHGQESKPGDDARLDKNKVTLDLAALKN